MFSNKKITNWMIENQKPINQDIDKRLTKIENALQAYEKRINTISDYIQSKLLKELIEADNKWICKKFTELKKELQTKGKK